jgi:cation diffusion facilitator CzcD-associated flavoprotein CzcO
VPDSSVPVAMQLDSIIIGAGFSGLYMLHRLRKLGLSARVFEAGDGIGGTWFWNRYPGARCDVESIEYSYSFSDELQQDWQWSERYPSQPEVLRYLEHVAERFDLRRDVQLSTRVTAAHFDEAAQRWRITTDRGEVAIARYCITAVGCLSAHNLPKIEGIERFAGTIHHTSRWPKQGVELAGKRVGVIGTGSTAIQLIPVVARQAAQLTVFQRTPNFSIPARNAATDPERVRSVKRDYSEIRAKARQSPFGAVTLEISPRLTTEVSPAELRADLEQRWETGGLGLLGAFADLLVSPEANQMVAEFVRDKIRQVVRDPRIAEMLAPRSYPVGCKRLCLDTGYYETFNRDNVALVDVNATPITAITPTGVRTTEREYPLDALILATGFDAMTGALDHIDIRGRGGASLKDKWAAGPRTYLGIASAGFPNLFLITGPQSPSVISNMVTSIEQHVEWIAELIGTMEARQLRLVDPTREAEDAWVEHSTTVANATIWAASSCNSWYLGSNVPGKPRIFTPYVGGVGPYAAKIQEVAQNGYEGFSLI